MNITISSRHLTLKPGDKSYAEEKFEHVSRIHSAETITVVVSEENQKIFCEAKIFVSHSEPIIITVDAGQVREAIDLTIDKCERQLRRLKEKHEDRRYEKK